MPDTSLESNFFQRFGNTPDLSHDLGQNPTLNALAARGSCRNFTADPVETAVLDTLCAAALCAPSKSDLQQRDILIITDPDLLNKLKTLLCAQDWIADMPALVIFLANNRRQRQIQAWNDQPFPNDHLDAFFNASVDAAIALAFFMVAAESIGLGCCPISTIRNHLTEVQKLLHLPDHVFPVAGMAVGYPAQKTPISARLSLANTVHHNSFTDVTHQAVTEYDTRRLAGADTPSWSALKARMYAEPQRTEFGEFIRSIGFKLE